ncbi:MAG: hypothetical protein ACJ780_22670 [Solirubrobacteraceae bacterium]
MGLPLVARGALRCFGGGCGGGLASLGAAIELGGLTLLGLSGVLSTLVAATSAVKRPDPVPSVFGYHEVFTPS